MIIKHREYIEETGHALDWDWVDHPGSGFSATPEVDANGIATVDLTKLNPAARKNITRCIENLEGSFTEVRYRTWEAGYFEPAILRCGCGDEVWLTSFTNTCDNCGSDYNMGGQLLAPREQWGEETGEHWTDCY